MQFDRNKLREVILYICAACPPELLGAVKLHKVLYFLDMIAFARSGRAITGAEYRKRPFGPTCVPLLAVLREMERDGDLTIGESDYFGLAKMQYEAERPAEIDRIGPDEVALLDEVIDFVCRRNSARTISEFSHQLPWEMANYGEVIGYDTALLLFPAEVSAEAIDTVQGGASEIEAARSKRDPVGRRGYRAFRSSIRAGAAAV